jgi:hypothetical protein
MPDLQSEQGMAAPAGPSSAIVRPDASSAVDALSHLHKMSGTGSAFGAADYGAINPVAIASVALALASALALALSLLLILPLAGVICALVAFRQIGNSNGTQTGRAFAAAGLLISLLLGGSVVAKEIWRWQGIRADTRQCAAMIERLGKDLHAERYDEIYQDLTTTRFRGRADVTLPVFRATLANFRFLPRRGEPKPTDPRYGHVDSIAWNGEPMEFQSVGSAETGVKLAYAMALVHFHDVPEPSRQYIRLSTRDGDWKIDGWERLFPEEKAARSSR